MARVPHPTKHHAALTYKEPTSVRTGRYVMSAVTVFVVLAVLYGIAWFATSMLLRSHLQDWFAQRSAEGYIAEYDSRNARISGFPFSVQASLKNVTFALPQDEAGKRPWVWSSQQVDFKIVPLPWTLKMVHVDLSAAQSLNIGGQNVAGRAKTFTLSLDWLSKGIPEDIVLDIKELALNGDRRAFGVGNLSVLAERQSGGDYAYDINGQNMDLPVGIIGLGRHVSDILLRGNLTHHFGVQGLGQQDMEKWRDEGGTLEVTRMQIEYDPLTLQGNGTLALDGDLQLVGAFSARIQGFFETVDRLRDVGVIRGPDASMAKVVLGMLQKHPRNGGPASISLPLTIQERALFAGPVRLIEMPQLKW